MRGPIFALVLAALGATGCPLEGECVGGAERIAGECRLSFDSGPITRDAGARDGSTDAPSDARAADSASDACAFESCDGRCVDTQTDPSHCGMCDRACAAGLRCVGGECVDALVQVGVGHRHTCAVRASGTALCWGSNTLGELGDGTTTSSPTPAPVVGLSGPVIRIEPSADRHTCALLESGGAQCWGNNASGQLGIGALMPASSTTPRDVLGLTDAGDISSGTAHVCALRRGGTVVCWGENMWGQLGNGGTTDRAAPVAVAGLDRITQLSAGGAHTCARRDDGSVWCWGFNSRGQTGEGTMPDVLTPFQVPGITDAIQVVAGSLHTCALRPTGVWCWGDNAYGQLGTATPPGEPFRLTPALVPGTETATSADAGSGSSYTCAAFPDGSVQCWGGNAFGVLGDGTTTDRIEARPVLELEPAAAITAGYVHTCAVLRSGGAACWGFNADGQLGDGSMMDRLLPVAVSGLP